MKHKTLSEIDASNLKALREYEDLLRKRLSRYGFCLKKRKTVQAEPHSRSKTKGFKITDTSSGDIMCGKNYDLTIDEVESFWREEFERRNAEKQKMAFQKRLKKLNAIQLDGGWIVTNDARALHALEDHIAQYGDFDNDGHGAGGDIASVMYRAYRPQFCPEFNRVWPLDGDLHNLTDVNLRSDVDETTLQDNEVSVTRQRRIWHNGRRIVLKLSGNEQLFFTVFTPELFSILCDGELLKSWYIYKKRLYCRVCGKIIAFADVIALFDGGEIDTENIAGSILEGKRRMKDNGLEVDHLRNNPSNNCPHSIAIMPKTINSRKNNILTKILMPYSFIAVRVEDKFRVLLGKFGTNDDYYRCILCNNAKQLLECLREFFKIANFSGEMRPAPKDRALTACISQTLQDDGEEYHGDQYNVIEGLLRADSSIFVPWDGDLSLLRK